MSSEAWIINASPLILFTRVDRLDLIERLAPGVAVPDAVITEVRAGQHKDSTAGRAVEWAQPYRVQDLPLIASVEHWDLGAGESQVIAHCIGRPRWASGAATGHTAPLWLGGTLATAARAAVL